jgi:tetratricopeptide (TPR) repeat protein
MDEHLSTLLALSDPAAQRRYVDSCIPHPGDELVAGLKEEATQVLRADVHRSLNLAALIDHLAARSGNPLHHALGLLAEANALSLGGLGEFGRALDLYNEAAAIYRAHDLPVLAANAQIAKILALSNLGRYDEALAAGEWAAEILEAHGEWLLLGKLSTNLGIIQYRLGEDAKALACYDRARDIYQSLGNSGEALKSTARAENNRAGVLRNLGRFDESIQASQTALELLTASGQAAEAARAKQHLAMTNYILGRYNDALTLLDEARAFFVADGRQRDAVLVELFISDCLLDLGRFADVLEKTRQVRSLFAERGASFEVGQAVLNEAAAYAGLRRYAQALAALGEARQIFASEGNATWTASTELETALVLYRLDRHAESLATAQNARAIFQAHNLPVAEAQAALAGARAAIALQRYDEARSLVDAARAVGETHDLPSLLYLCYHLLGTLAEGQAEPEMALARYVDAVAQVERLRHRLMVEYRIDFLEDKQLLYEDVVALSLALEQPALGLDYAERAKSRVLRELLDHRLELALRGRNPEEQALVDALRRLKEERDLLYRRWEGDQELAVRGGSTIGGAHLQVQQEVLALEKQMTELWHKLLMRNADYAADAMIWQVRTEPVQPYLPPDTLLLEYFSARGQGLVFAVSADAIQVYRLPGSPAQVQQAIRLLHLNFDHVAAAAPARLAALNANATGLLQQLYRMLLGPVEAQNGAAPPADTERSECVAPPSGPLARYAKWIVVPHGALHYVPFHALHDGAGYLTERVEISYLPGASLLRHVAAPRRQDGEAAARQALVLGHSYGGALPHTLEEAQAVAALLTRHKWHRLAARLYLEEAPTLERLVEQGSQAALLHLATHGDFRPDNPLFSGLALAGGWLTTLDIFNLRLQASLVTLSACQTGRNVIGGGDELLGLARAFLCAGASSLLLTLWAVEDRSTAMLMESFYSKLAAGYGKRAALRHAQCERLAARTPDAERYAHPYYWAPFILIGHTGQL